MRMFDVGIRASPMTRRRRRTRVRSLGSRPGRQGRPRPAPRRPGQPAGHARTVILVARLEGNPEAQRAFILGGPVAVGYR